MNTEELEALRAVAEAAREVDDLIADKVEAGVLDNCPLCPADITREHDADCALNLLHQKLTVLNILEGRSG